MPQAETIIVQCHTTSKDQLNLLRSLFRKYGQVTLTIPKDGTMDINCFLNNTFSFLLPKNDLIEPWIYRKKIFFISFMAGYIDAEGSFGIYQDKARFKMDSYDKNILKQIHLWLGKNKIKSKFLLVGREGEFRPAGYFFNSDLWRININEASSLFYFIRLIKPFIKHKKRINDIKKALNNIKIRRQKGTICFYDK